MYKKNIGVVCHDAGGAEIISSYILEKHIDPIYSLHGPSKGIFERKVGHINNLPIIDVVMSSELLICGTSWRSDKEWHAIYIANKLGKKTVSFLDHWVNYPDRYIRNNKTIEPDEYWVGDIYAERIANKFFQKNKIKLVTNPYFKEVMRSINRLERLDRNGNTVLYVCEPIREHAFFQYGDENHLGYTEESALKYFLSNLDNDLFRESKVLIRPHPSEDPDKYNWAHEFCNKKIEISDEKNLLNDIINSNIVIGCESMAMVIGLMAGKKVISSIPKNGRRCSLPFQKIENLTDIIF